VGLKILEGYDRDTEGVCSTRVAISQCNKFTSIALSPREWVGKLSQSITHRNLAAHTLIITHPSHTFLDQLQDPKRAFMHVPRLLLP